MSRAPVQALLGAFTLALLGGAAPLHAAGNARAPEIVEIKTSDNLTLSGAYYKPTADQAPGALLIHDAGASRAQLEAVAERLVKVGFGVLALDLRGHGASKTAKLDWDKLSESERKSVWSFAPRDLDAGASWLLSQPSIHSTRLSLVAYGAGCALAVRHAKSDMNVVCMTLLSPNPEDYGFDVRADIQMLEGLPTYVVTSKDAEGARMAQEANASAGGTPYVDVLISPPKLSTPLEDKAMPSRVAKWLSDKTLPKKGKG